MQDKYYNVIKKRIIDNEVYLKVKDYSKERYKVITYYEILELRNLNGEKQSLTEKGVSKIVKYNLFYK